MITRRHVKDDAPSTAVYSDCEAYRYALTRVWNPTGPRLLIVMLNPSTATEVQNDPTIERCERRARALGFGGFRACNIFALRETDPRRMRQAVAPTGPDNDAAILDGCAWADTILCAWGSHGTHLERGPQVERLLRATGRDLHTLGQTKFGHPRHPLYVAYSVEPALWPDAAANPAD
jgi:hypothetical protein